MKILALTILIASLVGCSSSPKIQAQKPQYCHTSQNILVKNGETVDSATLLECTDDQIKRMPAVKLGMASNCGSFSYWMKLGDKHVQRRGISCQKLDGTWEVINTIN